MPKLPRPAHEQALVDARAEALAPQIRAKRFRLGISLRDLGSLLDFSYQMLARAEKGVPVSDFHTNALEEWVGD